MAWAWGLLALGGLAGCQEQRVEGETVDGAPHRRWVYWFPDGQLEKAGDYQRGVTDGRWTFWYENGQRSKEGNYKLGQEDGVWTFWYDNGQREKSGSYVQGKEDGLWRFWDETGQLLEEGRYSGGERVGEWKKWDPVKESLESALPPAKDLSTLIAGMRTRDEARATEARVQLEQLGPQAVQALLDLLRDKEANVRARAMKALSNIGPKMGSEIPRTIPVFIESLGDSDHRVYESARDALIALGPELTLPGLSAALENSSPRVQSLAAECLAQFKGEAEPALNNLLAALRSPSAQVNAGLALAALGEKATPGLIGALGDSSPNVRIIAARALGDIGAAAIPAGPKLVELLADRDKRVTTMVMASLVKIGPEMVPLLVASLRVPNQDKQVRDLARDTLVAMGGAATEKLIEALDDPQTEVRWRAADALGKIGPEASASLAKLKELLAKDRDDTVQYYVKGAITKVAK